MNIHRYPKSNELKVVPQSSERKKMKILRNTMAAMIQFGSTADTGGQKLARGIEHQMLSEIQVQGELQDFINVLRIMEQYPEVSAIRAFIDVLPEGIETADLRN